MTSQRQIRVVHKNDLSAYLSNWRMIMNMIVKRQPPVNIPPTFSSLSNNTNDLSLMLGHLDAKLTILEETALTAREFDYQAYAEARVFLKASYLFFRILLDDISGIIRHFYKDCEHLELNKSFDKLLKKAEVENGGLPQDLCKLLNQSSSWFHEMRGRRVDLEHFYASLLITFEQGEDGKNILRHFSTKGHTTSDYERVREYFGSVLCGYQELIDSLLDHFDAKFFDWYRFKPHRDLSILEGYAGIMLWWAYEYGNYRHEDLQVVEASNGTGTI